MTRIGIPVPPGFTISTEICRYFDAHRRQYPRALKALVAGALEKMAKILGRRFGSADNPLLVSVRSGARESMPGMMDTVLNLGLNDQTVQGLIQHTGNRRFAYRLLIAASSRCTRMWFWALQQRKKATADPFETILGRKKKSRGCPFRRRA